MAGLIEEIQKGSIDGRTPLVQLLRQMKFAASKLNLEDLEAWVEHELNGYPTDGSELPAYRIQSGSAVGEHVVHGWQALQSTNPKVIEQLSIRPIYQSVGSLEALLADKNDGNLCFPFSAKTTAALLSANSGAVRQVVLMMDPSRLVDILDAVRNRILDWSLAMEKAGVTGEGMSFSESEKERAADVRVAGITINVSGENARATVGTDQSQNLLSKIRDPEQSS